MAQRAAQTGDRVGGSDVSTISGARPLWFDRDDAEVPGLAQPGSVALVGSESVDRAADMAVLSGLGQALGTTPVSVTEVALSESPAGTPEELLADLEGHTLLFDIEALCWGPWLKLDVRRFLDLHASRSGVVALWPGRIAGRVATFSVPGRKDHVRIELAGWTVLRPVPTTFPDQVPFEIERIAR